MAFTTTETKITAVRKAGDVLGLIRTAHDTAVRLQAALALYQGGTDASFNAAFDVLFTAGDRTVLGEMIGEIVALCITDWEATHPDALGT